MNNKDKLKLLEKDIEDLRDNLLEKETDTNPHIVPIERKKEVRILRGILKDKIATYNILQEAGEVIKE